jgi:hypothetical protein
LAYSAETTQKTSLKMENCFRFRVACALLCVGDEILLTPRRSFARAVGVVLPGGEVFHRVQPPGDR